MPLFSWPSGAKHAGSLYGGSPARITGRLNLLLRKCTASHAKPGAPYNTFFACFDILPCRETSQPCNHVEAAQTTFYARAANRTA